MTLLQFHTPSTATNDLNTDKSAAHVDALCSFRLSESVIRFFSPSSAKPQDITASLDPEKLRAFVLEQIRNQQFQPVTSKGRGQKYLGMGGLVAAATLLQACIGKYKISTIATTPATPATPAIDVGTGVVGTPVNVTVTETNGNVTAVATDPAAPIALSTGNGDDEIDISGSGANGNVIRAGAGDNRVMGGMGDDFFIIVGPNDNGGTYDAADLVVTNNNNITVDYSLNGVVSLTEINNPAFPSEATATTTGSITGGTGTDTLSIYGKVDISGITLNSVEVIDLHSDVTFTYAQLAQLAADGVALNGVDGESIIRIADIADATNAQTVTYSGGNLMFGNNTLNINGGLGNSSKLIELGENVTLELTQADLSDLGTDFAITFSGGKLKLTDVVAGDEVDLSAFNIGTSAADQGNIVADDGSTSVTFVAGGEPQADATSNYNLVAGNVVLDSNNSPSFVTFAGTADSDLIDASTQTVGSIVRGGAGSDSINTKNSVADTIVIVGANENAGSYTTSSLTVGSVDVSSVVTLAEINNTAHIDEGNGDIITVDSSDNVVIYGSVDMTQVTINGTANILYINSDVTITPEILHKFTQIIGGEGSNLRVVSSATSTTTSTTTEVVDLDNIEIKDIDFLQIQSSVSIAGTVEKINKLATDNPSMFFEAVTAPTSGTLPGKLTAEAPKFLITDSSFSDTSGTISLETINFVGDKPKFSGAKKEGGKVLEHSEGSTEKTATDTYLQGKAPVSKDPVKPEADGSILQKQDLADTTGDFTIDGTFGKDTIWLYASNANITSGKVIVDLKGGLGDTLRIGVQAGDVLADGTVVTAENAAQYNGFYNDGGLLFLKNFSAGDRIELRGITVDTSLTSYGYNPGSGDFGINNGTKTLYLMNNEDPSTVDFANLHIVSTDSGSTYLEFNKAPDFDVSAGLEFSLSESAAAGTEVFAFATSSTETDTVTYSLVADGDGNALGEDDVISKTFMLDGNSVKLKEGATLDYDGNTSSFDLFIMADDGKKIQTVVSGGRVLKICRFPIQKLSRNSPLI